METIPNNRVLVCPLGWGLGHASRLIPVILGLNKYGFEVLAAGDEPQMNFLKSHFPDIKTIIFPSLKVKLVKRSTQLLPLIGIAIKIPYLLIKEHFVLKRIVKDYNIGIVISDNRYGLWGKKIKSVLITHQLSIVFPMPFRFLKPVGEYLVRVMANRFTFCWLPDYADKNNLAGDLSHPKKTPANARYIGLLSRFQGKSIEHIPLEWDLVGIVSGPSPQRELLIESITNYSKKQKLKTLVVMGNLKNGTTIFENEGIFYTGHLKDNDFIKAVNSSKYLITRAGYSTIMDLVAVGKGGLIVPTPGQTEQEYIASYLSNKELFKTCQQDDLMNIDLSESLARNITFSQHLNLLDDAIKELITTIRIEKR